MNDQTAQTPNQNQSQALEDQNIFELLGVTEGTDEEREAFLDELQQVIWEDFLESDLKLLVTSEEYAGLEPLLQTGGDQSADMDLQEELVGKLEKLIPDLEEIMLEKALELKADLVRERIAGMKEYYSGNEAALNSLQEAEAKVMEDRWFDAAQTLNQI